MWRHRRRFAYCCTASYIYWVSRTISRALLSFWTGLTIHSNVEKDPQILNGDSNTSLAGLGIGLLSAAAVSLSTSLSDLSTAGADVVRIAFRLGIHVQAVSEQLEPRDNEQPDTWAYVVHNCDTVTVQQDLDTVQDGDGIPETGKIFISATSRNSVTLRYVMKLITIGHSLTLLVCKAARHRDYEHF
jgi:hypothetical protein